MVSGTSVSCYIKKTFWISFQNAIFIVSWTEAGCYTRTLTTVPESCTQFDGFAFALAVNTNEKTMAATALMSTFFALKFFVVIVLKFNVYTLLLFVSLFLFDNAKLWCFSSDSKKKLRFFSNLYGQTPHFRTNSGNRLKSCPKCYLGTNVTILF